MSLFELGMLYRLRTLLVEIEKQNKRVVISSCCDRYNDPGFTLAIVQFLGDRTKRCDGSDWMDGLNEVQNRSTDSIDESEASEGTDREEISSFTDACGVL